MDAKGPLWADIERIQVGDTAFVEARISEEDVDTFATLSGDQNPLHHDTELVHRLGHSRRIAHGALSIGLVSRLIGMNLPGPGSLWRKVTAEFVAPVLAGDTVRATVTVTRVSRGVGVVALDTKIERIPNTLVMRGTAEVMIVQEPAESPVIAPGKAMSLDGQVALVTGGGRGIGRAISLALARSAAKVVVNYRQNSATADETVKLIKHDGGEAVAVQADVASSDQVKSLVRSCLDEFGQVDILVNNATPELKSKLLMNTDYSDINEYFDVYVKGTLELVQQVVPDMQQRRYGRIISSLTSALTEVPPRLGSYVIAKSALYGLCRTLSVELAPFNITVNMVSPSVVLSDLTAQIGATATEAARRKIPLGRMAQPSEVAEAVLFLASPQSSFITGANLPVTGGVLS